MGIRFFQRIFAITFIFATIFSAASISFSQGYPEIPEFGPDDRIMIFAPHPDDEAIGTAGVIQRALQNKARVRVICYTNGDHNELGFMAYEKRIVFRKGGFIYMGKLRKEETVVAMNFFGLVRKDIVFLGYPDFGTMEILTKYWGKTKPFRYLLTRISKVPYPDCLSPGAPYVGESILADIKKAIFDFKPTKIFVSHPTDANRDHRALYLFLQVGLWDLEGQIKRPQIFPYIIHIVGWPKPRGYRPELALVAPSKKFVKVNWQKLSLTKEEINKKKDCIMFYKSELKPNARYLLTFARKNELFGDYPIIRLKKQDQEEISWPDCNNDLASSSCAAQLDFAYNQRKLYIKIPSINRIDKNRGSFIFLLGYSKETPFAAMPKISIYIDAFGLHIRDKKQTLFIKDAKLTKSKLALIVEIPVVSLGSPDYILASGRTRSGDLPFEETGWRIINLE
jgi:LmbE family N-acetylglucosaminyl deacetylase